MNAGSRTSLLLFITIFLCYHGAVNIIGMKQRMILPVLWSQRSILSHEVLGCKCHGLAKGGETNVYLEGCA
jgi:hypothetical protein